MLMCVIRVRVVLLLGVVPMLLLVAVCPACSVKRLLAHSAAAAGGEAAEEAEDKGGEDNDQCQNDPAGPVGPGGIAAVDVAVAVLA